MNKFAIAAIATALIATPALADSAAMDGNVAPFQYNSMEATAPAINAAPDYRTWSTSRSVAPLTRVEPVADHYTADHHYVDPAPYAAHDGIYDLRTNK